MKINIKELRKYLHYKCSLDNIVEKLNDIGFPVDNIIKPSPLLEQLRIALVTDKNSHPNNHELNLLDVEFLNAAGEKTSTKVVCGDLSMQIGDKAVLILTDEILPSTGKKLKPRLIAGIESGGMLCSGEELALQNLGDGVCKVDVNLVNLEDKVSDVLFQNGALLDIEITYNRGDLLSFYGLARELYAFNLGVLNKIECELAQFDRGDIKDCIKLETDLCSFYSLNYMKANEKMVELSNQILFEIGQPTHVFDADTLKGSVTVRLSQDKETFIDLHGKQHILPADLLVISDDIDVIAIAGVIGGLRTAFSDKTKQVAIEVACFDKDAVLKASQALNINTDAVKFFTHSVDPMCVHYAIGEYEKVLSEKFHKKISVGNLNLKKQKILFSYSMGESICGDLWIKDSFSKAMNALGFELSDLGDKCEILVPTYRHDIDCPEILIGEYLRFIGYDKLDLKTNLSHCGVLLEKNPLTKIQTVLSAQLHEVKTFKLISKENSQLLLNPITGYNSLRTDLIGNVLNIAIDNYKNNRIFNGLYEIGDVFDVEHLSQKQQLSVVFKGMRKFEPSLEKLQSLLGNLINLMLLDQTKIKYEHIDHEGFKPGACAKVFYKRDYIGVIGVLNHDLKSNVSFIGFEINLDLLFKAKKNSSQVYKPMQQVFTKDFSFKLTEEQTAQDLLDKLQKACPTIKFNIFDVFPENYLQNRNVGVKAVSDQEIDINKIENIL